MKAVQRWKCASKHACVCHCKRAESNVYCWQVTK